MNYYGYVVRTDLTDAERAGATVKLARSAKQPYHLDPDLNSVATGWPSKSPPLDEYDDPVPAAVVALFAARYKR